MKEQYITQIDHLLNTCDDMALLDLIARLLKKTGARANGK